MMPDFLTPRFVNTAAGALFVLLLISSVAWTTRVAKSEAATAIQTLPPRLFATKPSPARAATTGVVRLPVSVAGVLVDGSPRRVAAGSLQLTCGWHGIKAARQAARTVNVPCGGTADALSVSALA